MKNGIHKGKQGGFTILESLIAMSIGMAMLYGLVDFFKDAMEMQKLVRKHDFLTELEQRIQTALRDPVAVGRVTDSDPDLKTCLTIDGQNCPVITATSPRDMPVQWASGDIANPTLTPLMGKFNSAGKTCTTGCPVRSVIHYHTFCEEPTACDLASSIIFEYQILVGSTPFRQGTVVQVVSQDNISDKNKLCPEDANKKPQYIRAIDYGDLTCTQLATVNRTLMGVKPGECERGKEIIAGFAPTGDVVCMPITFTP